jgi:hypothetical protein
MNKNKKEETNNEIDAVDALQKIFDKECAKAVLKGIINEQGGDGDKEIK